MNNMKLAILILVIIQAYTLKLKSDTQRSEKAEVSTVAESEGYVVTYYPSTVATTYYTYTPVKYVYSTTTCYYCPYYNWFYSYPNPRYYVTYNFSYRAGAESEAETQLKVDDLKNELKDLKKEIWGSETYSTDGLRKENKIYDARWLNAQMKISRVAAIEDMITAKLSIAKRTESGSTSQDVSQVEKATVESKSPETKASAVSETEAKTEKSPSAARQAEVKVESKEQKLTDAQTQPSESKAAEVTQNASSTA